MNPLAVGTCAFSGDLEVCVAVCFLATRLGVFLFAVPDTTLSI